MGAIPILCPNLEKGDIVVVSNALFGLSEYEVLRIEGNKAITKFRIFNKRIYTGRYVYEYGKRLGDPTWTNHYWIKQRLTNLLFILLK